MKDNFYTKNSQIYNENCLVVLRNIEDNVVDSVITDPPYAISGGFMGKSWDKSLPSIDIWKQILRTTKPGGIMLVFGYPKTFHRLICLIEDSGWEVLDCISWIYGKGMPKGLNIGKAIDKQNIKEENKWNGWATGLKPAWEPIVVAMKPIEGTFIENAKQWGVAGFNIDDSRIELQKSGEDKRLGGNGSWKTDKAAKTVYGDYAGENISSSPRGRWPANLILSHHPECNELTCHIDCPISIMNKQSGELKSGSNCIRGKEGKFLEHGGLGKKGDVQVTYGDRGGASRFFYCTKAGHQERWFFCNVCKDSFLSRESPKHFHGKKNDDHIIFHPTVKPIDLIKYLCNLTRTPSGGIVLDPFMGTGTTGVACVETNRSFIGSEIEEPYYEIAKKRIKMSVDIQPKLFED